jgi:PAS domain S-box-containing protein/putative nucleotidyltransferase with HDIG domain
MARIKDTSYQDFIKLFTANKANEYYRLFFNNINAVIAVTDSQGIITYLNSYIEKISHFKASELIGKRFTKIIAPESIKITKKAWQMHLKGKHVEPYEVTYLDKDGSKVYCRLSTSLIEQNGKITGIFGIATDITEHKKTADHLSKMVKELSLLYQIGTELTSITNVDMLFLKILIHLNNTFGYERVGILTIDETSGDLVIQAAERPFSKRVIKKRVKLNQGITGYVARTGKPYLTNDVSKDTRYLRLDRKTKSEVCVPLKIGEKVIGVINVESYKKNAFDDDDVRILALIGNQAAVAFENSRLYKSLEASYLDTIKTLVLAMEAKDHDTRGHSERVRKYAIKIAEQLQLSDSQMSVLNYAGYLHDIGKIGISDFILNKKEPLTKSEYKIIKKHPEIGHNMLKGVKHLYGVCKIIRSEHEKFDGSGYPDGLRNREIPVGARIIAVADAYDAMTTDRPYRKALPQKEAVRRLKAGAGTQFDPMVVRAFLEVLDRK